MVTVKFWCGFKGNKGTLSIILQCIKHILHRNHFKIELHDSGRIENQNYFFLSQIEITILNKLMHNLQKYVTKY